MLSKKAWIALGVLGCMLLAFFLRVIVCWSPDFINGLPDPLGYVHRIELQLANDTIINQSAFWQLTDIMDGTFAFDGYLFAYLGTLVCKIFGAVTYSEICFTIAWIPPVCGSIIVLIVYFIGRVFGGWKTGLIASLLSAVMYNCFLQRTIFGYSDHHCLEILLTCCFVLFFLLSIKNKQGWKATLFPILAGISYGLSLLTIRTCVLFGLIAGIYLIIQFFVTYHKKENPTWILYLGCCTFGIAAITLAVHGITDFTLSFGIRSAGFMIIHILAVFVIFGFFALSILMRKLNRPTKWYIGIVVIIAGSGMLLIAQLFPDIWNMILGAAGNHLIFLPNTDVVATIGECQALNIGYIFNFLNIGIVFLVMGFVLACKHIPKHDESLFLIIWSVILFYISILHVRWTYYSCFCAFIFIALAIVWTIKKWKLLKTKESRITLKQAGAYTLIALLILFAVLSPVITIACANQAVKASTFDNTDYEAFEWLNDNTPDVGLDYYHAYRPGDVVTPNYTVIGGWTYGFFITTLGHRIPISNAIYEADGDADANGRTLTADIFICPDENKVYEWLESVKARYIIITEFMVETAERNIAPWSNYDYSEESFINKLWNGKVERTKLEYEKDHYRIFSFS